MEYQYTIKMMSLCTRALGNYSGNSMYEDCTDIATFVRYLIYKHAHTL